MMSGFDLFRFIRRLRLGLALTAVTALFAVLQPGDAVAASSFDCTVHNASGALNTFLQSEGDFSFDTVTITGSCAGNVFLPPNITIQASAPGDTIAGSIDVGGYNVTLSGVTIDGGGANAVAVNANGSGASVTLSNCTVQNWTGTGDGAVAAFDGGSVQMSGGTIQNIAPVSASDTFFGAHAGAGSVIKLSSVAITNSTSGAVDGFEGRIELSSMNIHDNGGYAIFAQQSDVVVFGGTISAPAANTTPAIALIRSSLVAQSNSMLEIAGTGHSNTIFETSGSSVTLEGATVISDDATDPTILVSDGSALVSTGGNTITNSAGGGTVLTVANGSAFHERSGVPIGVPAAADAISGGGTVQMQSNMELGTGSAAPSGWTGTIAVAQNSSFRMDGGMTITGQAQIGQGSNGFFNKTAGGSNVVTAGVSCLGSTSHIVGPAAVTQTGGGSAVTLVTTGAGCYSF